LSKEWFCMITTMTWLMADCAVPGGITVTVAVAVAVPGALAPGAPVAVMV